jgi:RHS repeat-associated protein
MSVGSLRIGVPSPTASSLGKFGDIPVSLYTGLPDIEIPLYTVNLTALKRYIFNRPVSVYTTGGAEHRYYYDHNGNRVRKRIGGSSDYYVNGIDGRTDVVTNNTSSWATYTLYGLDQIGQVRRDGIVWTRFYYLKDHVGSVRVIVNASGNRVAHTDMDPFGYEMPGRVQDSSSVDGRYKFTGKERDTETTYDYFGARYYDARIGRFLSVDPLADDERLIGWSPYHYGYDNPMRYFDKIGMRPRSRDEDENEQLRKLRETASTAREIDGEEQMSTDQEDESSDYYHLVRLAKLGLNVSGVAGGVGEYSNIIDDWWYDPIQKQWYSKRFYGNPHTSKQAQVVARAMKYKKFGTGTFYSSALVSAFEGGIAAVEGNTGGLVKAGLDIAMARISLLGPKGLAIGSTYFILDALGLFESYTPDYPPQPFGVPDKTYVAPQKPILKP